MLCRFHGLIIVATEICFSSKRGRLEKESGCNGGGARRGCGGVLPSVPDPERISLRSYLKKETSRQGNPTQSR